MNNFESYPSFDHLDQANLRCFSHMSSKLIKQKYPGYILSIFMCFCSFHFFQENYPYAVKMNNFGSYTLFDPLDQDNFKMFLTYVIKVDKIEVFRLYFEHSYVLLLFLAFPGKLPLCSQSE